VGDQVPMGIVTDIRMGGRVMVERSGSERLVSPKEIGARSAVGQPFGTKTDPRQRYKQQTAPACTTLRSPGPAPGAVL
jgi:hypothetical protein